MIKWRHIPLAVIAYLIEDWRVGKWIKQHGMYEYVDGHGYVSEYAEDNWATKKLNSLYPSTDE